jgi:hypothetical protein
MLTLARCDFGQDFIAHGDGLADGIDSCITSQTLDMTTHVLGHHGDDSSLSTCTGGTA